MLELLSAIGSLIAASVYLIFAVLLLAAGLAILIFFVASGAVIVFVVACTVVVAIGAL